MAKTLTVTLHKSEMIYQVQNKTYLTGLSRENGQNFEQVANLQANDDDDHMNQIIRSMDGAFAELKTKLSQYISSTTEPLNGYTANNVQLLTETVAGEVTTPVNYILTLDMPSNFNDAVKETIAAACDKYVVNTAIADWFVITKPDEAPSYISLATVALQTIREAINKRISPTRTTPVV